LDYFQRDMSRSGISTGTTSRDFDRFIELAYVMRAEPINPWKDAGARGGKSTNLSRNGSFSSRFGGISSQSQASDDDEFPLMICYPEKMVRETVSLFATRFNMHQQVYTHKSVKQVEFMITDALQLADPYIRIQGSRHM
jgi:HD superfamily phosphohydrolase